MKSEGWNIQIKATEQHCDTIYWVGLVEEALFLFSLKFEIFLLLLSLRSNVGEIKGLNTVLLSTHHLTKKNHSLTIINI